MSNALDHDFSVLRSSAFLCLLVVISVAPDALKRRRSFFFTLSLILRGPYHAQWPKMAHMGTHTKSYMNIWFHLIIQPANSNVICLFFFCNLLSNPIAWISIYIYINIYIYTHTHTHTVLTGFFCYLDLGTNKGEHLEKERQNKLSFKCFVNPGHLQGKVLINRRCWWYPASPYVNYNAMSFSVIM